MKTALERYKELAQEANWDTMTNPPVVGQESSVPTPSEDSNALIGRMPLSEFATAKKVVPIMSDVLGEKVYFVSDNVVIEVDENGFYRGCVVYRSSELKELFGTSDEHKQTIHEIKKVFGNGRVVADAPLPGAVQEEMQL